MTPKKSTNESILFPFFKTMGTDSAENNTDFFDTEFVVPEFVDTDQADQDFVDQDYIHSPNFDGFITKQPYCYGWTTNANGVKVPVFPYVISILGHLNLRKMGVRPEEEERTIQLMRNTLAVYLEQVIRKWQQKRHFWQKNSDIPLIILINIANQIGELVTDTVEELQKKYPFVRLIAVLPLPKDVFIQQLKEEGESLESIKTFEKRYFDFKKDEFGQKQKYIWELSKRDMPHIAEQTKLKKWRMFNEFVAQNSHLMIVFWEGEKEALQDRDDDSMAWVVRYKLEGYPGLSRHEQTDFITHPATGPVLHIQTDLDTFRKSRDFLPVHYYADRATITEEKDGERKLIISDPKFWDLEKLRHRWFGKKFADIGRHPEIDKNFRILKDLNYACRDKTIPLTNVPVRDYIEKYVTVRYRRSKKPLDKKLIPEPDNPTGQLIASYKLLDTLAEYYATRTRRLLNLFCGTFLVLLIFNAILIFLNDMCISGFGHNIFHLTQYYTSQQILYQSVPFEGNFLAPIADFAKEYIPPCEFDYEMEDLINSQALYISRIIGMFLFTCFMVFLCVITIFYCCVASCKNLWHFKYHQIRTLADCLLVQVFWKTGGMDYSVSANFRSHQIPAADWLFMALNGLNVTLPNSDRIESKQELKNRIRLLDTIWVEDRIQAFKRMNSKSRTRLLWENLTVLSKWTFLMAVSVIPFLTAFFTSLAFQSCWGKLSGFEGLPFMNALFIAGIATFVFWLLVFVWLLFKATLKWVKIHLKWAEIYYSGFYGFLGNIYRMIKQNNTAKRYYFIPNRSTIFRAFIIIIACFGAFFELRRSNLIYTAAQNPSTEHMYNFLMVFRLVTQVTVSIMAIGWLFNRMSMTGKKRRRIEQLKYPFEMADYSIDTLLEDEKAVENINTGFWDQIMSWYRLPSDTRPISQNDVNNEENDEDAKIKICQQVLLELGQEVLAKRADWLLAVSDRNLQSPK